jgi:hypothetical protein
VNKLHHLDRETELLPRISDVVLDGLHVVVCGRLVRLRGPNGTAAGSRMSVGRWTKMAGSIHVEHAVESMDRRER